MGCVLLCNGTRDLAGADERSQLEISMCTPYLTPMMHCMLHGRDVTPCCKREYVPLECLPMCSMAGRTSINSPDSPYFDLGVKPELLQFCLLFFDDIRTCAFEGLGKRLIRLLSMHLTTLRC